MEHQVLMRPGVGQHERASFQSPEQTSSVQKDRVEREPSLVGRWNVRRGGLLLYLKTHQPCDESNNVGRSLDDLELMHEAAGWEGAPLPRNSATVVERPPEPG